MDFFLNEAAAFGKIYLVSDVYLYKEIIWTTGFTTAVSNAVFLQFFN